MKKSGWIAMHWLVTLCAPFLLTACFYSLAGLDMSIEGRHKMWVEDMQSHVGESVYGCSYWYCVNSERMDLFLGSSLLGNGNVERGFRYGRFDTQNPSRFPQCRYFFEHEPKTGTIVRFRFEESERFACRFTGA